jgi:hypothetical protein
MKAIHGSIRSPYGWAVIISLAVLVPCAGCGKSPGDERGARIVQGKDIQKVMDAHVKELMAIPGVVGVAIGALDDGKPCILVLVVKRTPETLALIPRMIEGYPVKVDESGEIRAMPGDSTR